MGFSEIAQTHPEKEDVSGETRMYGNPKPLGSKGRAEDMSFEFRAIVGLGEGIADTRGREFQFEGPATVNERWPKTGHGPGTTFMYKLRKTFIFARAWAGSASE